ncbi:MAG: glycosyltransferase family 39 protein [Candidatus Scalindua sp. SCAELEC01]|nr:MAG: glycosyltransferase family 39 protein [Candidatus Scalindua sp. SCAELEC01]
MENKMNILKKIRFKLLDSHYWLVVLILAVSFVGIFDHDLWTSDEPRVAEIGREFLDDGASLAVPRLGGKPFLEKPPLYFWCVALSYKVFGGPSASAARLPSLFFGLGTLVFTYFLARKMYDRNSALWSCIVLALSTEYFTITHKSLVDISLVFFVTGTVYWLYLALTGEKDKKGINYTLCYIFSSGAFFSKGFLGLAFPAMVFICWIVWTRHWNEIKKTRLWIGFFIVGGGISLWFFALWKAGSWEYLSTFLVHNNLQRFMPGAGYSGGHERPFYYYMCVYWSAFAPWSILTPAVLFSTYRKGFQDKNRLFLVLWFFSGFLMLSFAETKRTIYIVPLLPPISILTGAWFSGMETRRVKGRLDRASQWFIMCICGMSIVLLPVLALRYDLFKTVSFIVSLPILIICYIALFYSFITCKVIKLYSSHNGFRIKSEIKLSEYNYNQDLVSGPPGLSAVRTGKTENQIGFSIYGLPTLVSLIYISFILVSYPYINEHKSLRPFCNTLGQIPEVEEKPVYAFCPDETTEAMVPFYTGNYITPIYELEEIKALGKSRDAIVLVVDKQGNRPLYNGLKDLFSNTLVSGQTGRRRMVLLSNFSRLKDDRKHYSSNLEKRDNEVN